MKRKRRGKDLVMRIVSFNVNGIRAIEKRGFLDWLKSDSPDILCIQETKAHPAQLSPGLLVPLDNEGGEYKSFWASAKKKGYAGVAIYSKREPVKVEQFGVEAFDDEGRVLKADYGDFVLFACYFPNSQEQRARLDYKIDFCREIKKQCTALIKAKRHFIVCGDYNIAHKPIDLGHPKENENSAGYYPEERAFMDEFLNAGFVDAFRHFYPEKTGAYTWWSYRAGARERNVGWRIDYHCVDTDFIPSVKDVIIRSEVMGSDHCPVELVLQ
jgi:exodeoxyribonuclease-3